MGQLGTNQLYARNIFLIGTAEKGPVNSPILAKSIEHVRSIFGSKGSLFETYSIIADTDIPCTVHLCKTSGSHGELYLNVLKDNGDIIENGFYIKSKHANESANDIEIYLDDNFITFTYPDELGGNTLSYSLNNYNTLHDLANAINEDTKLLKGEVFCFAYCEPHISCKFSLSPVNSTQLKLIGGDSGLRYNKNMLYNCMSTTYSALEGYPTDIIVPLDAFYDDTLTDDIELLEGMSYNKDYLTLQSNGKYLSFYKQLVSFCKLQMQSSIISHGVMGMHPTNKYEVDETKLLSNLDICNNINILTDDLKKYSHMVSVVVSDVYALYGTIVTNAYIAYAVLIASTKISETTTNKSLPSSFVLYNVLEQDTLKKISDKGYVCFRNSPITNSIHVVNGVTKSVHAELKYFCNVRMIQVVMKNIKSELSNYIGRNIEELIESGEINTKMSQLLSSLYTDEFVRDFSALNVIKKDDSHLMVNLSFATKYMVEEIDAYSGLSSL